MRVEVNTSEYRFSHGREPRGRGLWCFALSGYMKGTEFTEHNGTYSEAKAKAVREARAIGFDRVNVLP